MKAEIKNIFLAVAAVTFLLHMHMHCKSVPGGILAGAENESLQRPARDLMKTAPGIRFGVMDFSDPAGNFTAVGILVGDETLYRLEIVKDIQIIERRKLQDILEDAKLSEAGITAENVIQKIGKILPVDILVTGSYIPVGERIRVNGRFTDVKTGEIKGTFLYFLDAPRSSSSDIKIPDEKDEDCSKYEAAIEPYLQDLRSPAMIERAVDAAVKIPFTYKCRQVHNDIMIIFRRGNIYPEKYYNFLHDTVISIQDPEEVDRKSSVFYYFRSDKNITDREFNTGLLALYIADDGVIQRIVRFILNTSDQNIPDLIRRCDQLLALAGEGVIGRPHILSRDKMFGIIFRSGSASSRGTIALRKYMLQKHADKIARDDRTLSYIINTVESTIVSASDDKNVRTEFYKLLGDFLSDVNPDEKNSATYGLMQFYHEIIYRYGKTDGREIKELGKKTAPLLCYSVLRIRQDYRMKGVLPLLNAFQVKCTQ